MAVSKLKPPRDRAKPIPTERVKELLEYDPQTGVFVWRVTRCGKALVGDVAGRVSNTGRRQIQIDGSLYSAHRIAYALVHGDGDPLDNRIANLRAATRQQNNHNRNRLDRRNKSGVNGVYFETKRGRWRASITLDGVLVNLGYFDTVEEAAEARLRAEHAHYPYAKSNRAA